MTRPYVYKCMNKITGEYYFGYRSRNKVPAEEDLGVHYFTSSKQVKHRFDEFDYEILQCFDNKLDAHTYEQTLIKENWGDPLLLNKAMFPRIRNRGSEKQKAWARHRMLTNNPMKQPEQRELARIRNTGKRLSEETKQKISASNLGRKLPKRPGTQTGDLNCGAKHYIFKSPDGKEHLVVGGFRKFCIANGLGHNSCIDVAKGRRANYKGWTIKLDY